MQGSNQLFGVASRKTVSKKCTSFSITQRATTMVRTEGQNILKFLHALDF